MATKFQSESTLNTFPEIQFENQAPLSSESIIAKLESIILGLCIRSDISSYDKKNLDLLFSGHKRLLVVKDNNCIYPQGVEQAEFSLCLVFTDNELNVCDLNDNYPEIVTRLENAWPSLLAAASRIRETFEISDAAVLINRTSGRILAPSAGFISITGLNENTIIGAEYSAVSAEFEKYFQGKRLSMNNLRCDEVHFALMSISSVVPNQTDLTASRVHELSNEKSHRFIHENEAVDMYLHRFNALLETSSNTAIPPQTLIQVESVIAKMCGCSEQNCKCTRTQIESANINAVIRLMVQSLLMSHRTIAGEASATEILVYRNEHNDLQIRFDTPAVLLTSPNTVENEWYQLAVDLSKRINITIGELQYALNSISTKIFFTSERKPSHDSK